MYFCFSVDYAFVSRIALHQYFLNSQEDSHVNSFGLVFPFQKFCGVGFKLAVMPSILSIEYFRVISYFFFCRGYKESGWQSLQRLQVAICNT